MDVASNVSALAKQLIETITYQVDDPAVWPHFAGTGEIYYGNGILAWHPGMASERPSIPNMPEDWKFDRSPPRYDELFENVRTKQEFFSEQLSKSELIRFVKLADPGSGLIQLAELAELVAAHLSDYYENNFISVKFVTCGALATRLTHRQQRHSRLLALSRWLAQLQHVQPEPNHLDLVVSSLGEYDIQFLIAMRNLGATSPESKKTIPQIVYGISPKADPNSGYKKCSPKLQKTNPPLIVKCNNDGFFLSSDGTTVANRLDTARKNRATATSRQDDRD